MAKNEKIVRKKLSDEVFYRLVEILETEDLKPGDPLPSERELMERFGVGRPAIREAMQSLEAKGLISISHGERAKVATPTITSLLSQIDLPTRRMLAISPSNLDNLKEVRVFFERGMVKLAASQAKPEDIERLQAHLDHQTKAYGVSDEEFMAADMAFHSEIAAISGNPIFEAVSKAMLGWFSEFHQTILHWKGNERVTLEEHGKIIECIAANDPERAVECMENHLKRTRLVYAPENQKNRDNGDLKEPS